MENKIEHLLAYSLFQLLGKAELKELEVVTKTGGGKKRKRDRLWKALLPFHGKSKPPEKEKLFEQVFGETYTPEKDYLLRNEFRHLSKAIRKFLAVKGFLAEIDSGTRSGNVEMLSVIEKRGESEMWTRLHAQALQERKKKGDPVETQKLLRQRLRFLAGNGDHRSAKFHDILKSAKEAVTELSRSTQYELGEINTIRAFADFVLWTRDATHPRTESFLLEKLPEDPYSRYLDLAAQTYQLPGETKWAVLRQALETLPEVNTVRIRKKEVMARVRNNFALELMNARRFEEALDNFEGALELAKKFSLEIRQTYSFNRVTCLARMGRPQEALDALLPILENKGDHPFQEAMQDVEVQLLIELGRFETARKKIREILPFASDNSEYYLRLCLAIAWAWTGDLEFALRETNNIRQALLKSHRMEHFRQGATWLNRFLVLKSEPDEKKRNRGLKKLKGEVAEIKTNGPHMEMMPLVWVRRLIVEEARE